MSRSLSSFISQDLNRKIVLLSGPRQVGKTTLARSLMQSADYLNFDDEDDRKQILVRRWDRKKDLLILDEIHKMTRWKAWLKGIFDKEGVRPRILVTGSARMDIARKMGDSLAGRYFQYQLFPLDLKELSSLGNLEVTYQTLVQCSGFPEPFIEGNVGFYTKWKRTHLDVILRQDLITLEAVRDISTIETLLILLQGRVASPFSYSSVGGDLQRDVKTVQRWIEMLENLYLVFRIQPYTRNIARSILKEPKLYFFDYCRVDGDDGVVFENVVAVALKKEVSFLNEALGVDASLHTLRIKGGREIDFLVLRKGLPPLLIEAKLSDSTPSPNFALFRKYFPGCYQIQLVRNLTREFTTPDGIQVQSALPWLQKMDLSKASQ
ncbi:MAG: ATP-binding protein [Deltaproteobacteria bacterium]|nr:ATP-binding protein [Deltaproteobacteria bacterium]